jgi:hypothetical protein
MTISDVYNIFRTYYDNYSISVIYTFKELNNISHFLNNKYSAQIKTPFIKELDYLIKALYEYKNYYTLAIEMVANNRNIDQKLNSNDETFSIDDAYTICDILFGLLESLLDIILVTLGKKQSLKQSHLQIAKYKALDINKKLNKHKYALKIQKYWKHTRKNPKYLNSYEPFTMQFFREGANSKNIRNKFTEFLFDEERKLEIGNKLGEKVDFSTNRLPTVKDFMEAESEIFLEEIKDFIKTNEVKLSKNLEEKFNINNFNLKHYTDIDFSNHTLTGGLLKSSILLPKKSMYDDNSFNDKGLFNTGFLFFHMQPKDYDVHIKSRFGKNEITIEPENIRFHEDGYVSLTEQCQNTLRQISDDRSNYKYWDDIKKYLKQKKEDAFVTKLLYFLKIKKQKNNIYRTGSNNFGGAKITQYGYSRVDYCFKGHLKDRCPRQEGFFGKYISEGLYYASLLELYLIGGNSLINYIDQTINNDVENFGLLLRTLFRLEAHVPRSVRLSLHDSMQSQMKLKKTCRFRKYNHNNEGGTRNNIDVEMDLYG